MLCILENGENLIIRDGEVFMTRARSLLSTLRDESVVMSKRLQDDAKKGNFEQVSPFSLYMLYKMGNVLLRRVELMDKTDRSETIERLTLALQATTKRWPVAGKRTHDRSHHLELIRSLTNSRAIFTVIRGFRVDLMHKL